MKKLVLMFVAIAAISFASCGNKAAAPAPVEDTTEVVQQDTVAEDTVAEDTTATTAE